MNKNLSGRMFEEPVTSRPLPTGEISLLLAWILRYHRSRFHPNRILLARLAADAVLLGNLWQRSLPTMPKHASQFYKRSYLLGRAADIEDIVTAVGGAISRKLIAQGIATSQDVDTVAARAVRNIHVRSDFPDSRSVVLRRALTEAFRLIRHTRDTQQHTPNRSTHGRGCTLPRSVASRG